MYYVAKTTVLAWTVSVDSLTYGHNPLNSERIIHSQQLNKHAGNFYGKKYATLVDNQALMGSKE